MDHDDRTLIVGAGTGAVNVTLTSAAIRVLDQLSGTSPDAVLRDHRSLLTTIAVGRAAAGPLIGGIILVDAPDIIDAIEHAAPQVRGQPVPHARSTGPAARP